MNLTGQQLVDRGIITGNISKENIQQHGVDLNVISIALIDGTKGPGFVPEQGKTTLAQRVPISTEGRYKEYWKLSPGAYEVTLSQGCKVPPDQKLLIVQRSSLLRNGTILQSSIFDAGFETDQIGTVMIVMTPIIIGVNARIAQIFSSNSNVVSEDQLYSGQWQNDNQRK